MKRTLLILVTVLAMLLSATAGVLADGAGDSPQHRIQKQDRDQTNINLLDQQQARNHLRARFQVTDEARSRQQERLQQMEPGESRFSDSRQHWAREQINQAYAWGLVSGYPDGGFRPGATVSGPEAVIMLARMMQCLTGEGPGDGSFGPIDWDRVPLWARAQLQEATALQIATQSRFYAEQQLNRLQVAVMLCRALGIGPVAVPDGTVVFLDQETIPGEDLPCIHALRRLGLVTGYNGLFDPLRAATRAEVVSMLVNALDILAGQAEWSVAPGQFVVTLAENPSTGYSWSVHMDPEGIVELTGESFDPAETAGPLVGAGGLRRWVFATRAPGTVRLTFHYARPWEGIGTAIDSRTYVLQVDSGGQILQIE